MGFEDFLQSIVVLINEANNQRRIEIVQREADRISNFYYGVNREDLFRRLHQELEQDVELYYLVLFAIYFVVKDPKCLEVMECLLFHRELDIFVAENIIFQLKNFKFRDINIPVSYRKEREINEYLLNRYLEEYPINIPFLPYPI